MDKSISSSLQSFHILPVGLEFVPRPIQFKILYAQDTKNPCAVMKSINLNL